MKEASKKVTITIAAILICLIICTLPLSITSIVLGAIRPGNCDNKTQFGMDTGQYLIGSGISSIISLLIYIVPFIFLYFTGNEFVGTIVLLVVSIIVILFDIIWFIIGGFVLFQSNIECIKSGSSHVVYCLVLWIMLAVQILTKGRASYK